MSRHSLHERFKQQRLHIKGEEAAFNELPDAPAAGAAAAQPDPNAALDAKTLHRLEEWLLSRPKESRVSRLLHGSASHDAVIQELQATKQPNDILAALDLPKLIGHIEDKAKVGKFPRIKLYSVLTSRLHELTTASKAALLAGITSDGGHKNDVAFGVKLVQSCVGEALERFLHASEAQEHALSVFVYDRASEAQKETILGHVRDQTAANTASGLKRPLHILSDVDDTFVHSGYGLGGPKFPKGTVMPGIKTLFARTDAFVAFLTARPDFVQEHTFRAMRGNYGMDNFTVLSGKLGDSVLIPFSPDTANRWISQRKYDNFCMFHDLFVGNRFLWFGDSGQGDIITGEMMLADPDRGPSVLGVFIQDVATDTGLEMKTPPETRAEYRARPRPIHIVDNYAEVAVELYRQGIIDGPMLRATLDAAEADLEAASERFSNEAVLAARRAEFGRHLVTGRALLAKAAGGEDP